MPEDQTQFWVLLVAVLLPALVGMVRDIIAARGETKKDDSDIQHNVVKSQDVLIDNLRDELKTQQAAFELQFSRKDIEQRERFVELNEMNITLRNKMTDQHNVIESYAKRFEKEAARVTLLETKAAEDAHKITNLQQQVTLYEEVLRKTSEELEAVRNDMAAKDKISTEVIARLSEQVNSLETRLKELTGKYNKAVKERDEAVAQAKEAQEQADTATAILAEQRVKIIDLTERLTSLETRARERDENAQAA